MAVTNPDDKFQIEIDEETAIGRDAMVEHVEHGAMHVESISVGPNTKRAQLQAERGPVGLKLTGEEIREQWGDTIHFDPAVLYDGETRYEKHLASEDTGVEVTLKVEGPEERAEPVMAHLDDQAVRVLQAVEQEKPPEDCEGVYDIDWEGIFEDGDDDGA